MRLPSLKIAQGSLWVLAVIVACMVPVATWIILSTSPPSEVVERLPERSMPLPGGKPERIAPYVAETDILKGGDFTQALIVIHGTRRDALDTARVASLAAVRAGVAETTCIIAPQFLTEADALRHGLDDAWLRWSAGGWKKGERSLGAQAPGLLAKSSFEVLDEILRVLSSPEKYPRMRRIVIAGHSAGAQFVNRYAATSQAHRQATARGMELRYVAANPSNWLYFSNERPVAGRPGEFAVPDRNDCPGYDNWKYGLSEPNRYAHDADLAALSVRYLEREVVYLLGDGDAGHEYLDISCAAMLQGATRLERGLNYWAHLKRLNGGKTPALQRLAFVPDATLSKSRMLLSPEGLSALFGPLPAQEP